MAADDAIMGFTTPQVAAISGVPMSTLHYWATTGIVTPSIRASEGRRVTRWWSLTDLVAVRSVKALREAGCPLQTLRQAQALLEGRWDDARASAVLYWDGAELLEIDSIGSIRSAVRHPGQGVLHLLAIPVGQWRSEHVDQATVVDVARLEDLRRKREGRSDTPITPVQTSSARVHGA